MTSRDAAKLVTTLAAAYPVPGWETETMRVFAELLADLDAPIAEAAVLDWIRTESQRPTIADVRKRVAMRRAGNGERAPMTAEEAWGYVRRQINHVGTYGTFPRTYPLVAQAVDAIGWRTLCMSENESVDRAHFFRVYAAIAGRVVSDAAAAPHAALPDRAKVVPMLAARTA